MRKKNKDSERLLGSKALNTPNAWIKELFNHGYIIGTLSPVRILMRKKFPQYLLKKVRRSVAFPKNIKYKNENHSGLLSIFTSSTSRRLEFKTEKVGNAPLKT